MKYLEKFNLNKMYMFPNGQLATKEKILIDYPAVQYFTFVAETDKAGEVLLALDNLSALRGFYNIDENLSEDEAIEKIEEILNTPQEISSEPTTEERTAAALEQMAEGATSQSTEAMNILLTGEEE